MLGTSGNGLNDAYGSAVSAVITARTRAVAQQQPLTRVGAA